MIFQIYEGVCGLCSSKDQSQVASITKQRSTLLYNLVSLLPMCICVYLDLRSLQVGLPVGEVCSLRVLF